MSSQTPQFSKEFLEASIRIKGDPKPYLIIGKDKLNYCVGCLYLYHSDELILASSNKEIFFEKVQAIYDELYGEKRYRHLSFGITVSMYLDPDDDREASDVGDELLEGISHLTDVKNCFGSVVTDEVF